MNPHQKKEIEIWRVSYEKDAYTDPSGATHWGNIVRDRQIVTYVDSEEWIEPYSNRVVPDGIAIFKDKHGDRYKRIPSIDYAARSSLRNLRTGDFWVHAPVNTIGYYYPDGTAPVERLS